MLLSGCYPISVFHTKWRIRWDKDKKEGKEQYFSQPLKTSQSKPPNVVLIVCDDLGKYEVSAYGAEHIQTPHIDQIGQEGVIFQEGYVTVFLEDTAAQVLDFNNLKFKMYAG